VGINVKITEKWHEPEEVPPNKPVPAAGCPVLVAAPVPPPNATQLHA